MGYAGSCVHRDYRFLGTIKWYVLVESVFESAFVDFCIYLCVVGGGVAIGKWEIAWWEAADCWVVACERNRRTNAIVTSVCLMGGLGN